jgi:hypothetical protein
MALHDRGRWRVERQVELVDLPVITTHKKPVGMRDPGDAQQVAVQVHGLDTVQLLRIAWAHAEATEDKDRKMGDRKMP